jgi:hypothetical protein
VFSGVSSLCKKDAEVPGDYWSGFVIADEIDGIGDKKSGPTTIVDSEACLGGLFEGRTDFGVSFLNCQSNRIAVIAAGLKEFYCAYITFCIYYII